MKNELITLKLNIKNAKGEYFKISNYYEKSDFSKSFLSWTKNIKQEFLLPYKFSEIKGNLDIESDGSSRKRIQELISGKSLPKDDNEVKIINLHQVYTFIETVKPKINKENIMLIYKMLKMNIDMGHNELEDNNDYRQTSEGEVHRFDTPSKKVMNDGMDELIKFINSDIMGNTIIEKAVVIQILFIYFHPFYDFNGRTGRVLTYWFLVLNGYQDVAKILNIALPNEKKKYMKAWDSFRKTSSSDLCYWMMWLCDLSNFVRSKIEALSELTIKNGIKLNETETLILFKLLDSPVWYTAKSLEEAMGTGISKQGIFNAINSLASNKLIVTKISKNTMHFSNNVSFKSNQDPLYKTLEKYLFETNDFSLKDLDIFE